MIQEYTNYLRSIRGYSENTIRAYGKDIEAFAAWLRRNKPNATWTSTTREDVDAYITEQVRHGQKPSSTNRHISAISSLYRYMQRQGYTTENPCRYESRRKQPQKEPRTLSVSAISKAYAKSHGLTKTLLGILATTGVRIQELLELKWEDIDFTTNTIRVNGKGSKERSLQTESYILQDLKEVSQYTHPRGRIFYISQRYARYLIHEALRPYSNSPQLSPHVLRHTFATELAKAGITSTSIAKALGHSNLTTSQKYINMAEIPVSSGIIKLI